MRRSRGSPITALILAAVVIALRLAPDDWFPEWFFAAWFQWSVIAILALVLAWGGVSMWKLTRQMNELLDDIPGGPNELGEPLEPTEAMLAVDALDDAIHDASEVPFTNQVRLDRGRAERLVERLRTALPRGSSQLSTLFYELDQLVRNAKPIPLLDQIRLNRDEVFDIVDRMRASFAELR